ncbi:hypothetical protein J6590_092958 [Homalodisca vitripennis]|nr:hypothetical protein J6590_092958 [Homalodisca vitripennis]
MNAHQFSCTRAQRHGSRPPVPSILEPAPPVPYLLQAEPWSALQLRPHRVQERLLNARTFSYIVGAVREMWSGCGHPMVSHSFSLGKVVPSWVSMHYVLVSTV